jgi:hypothetical protein
VNNDSALVVLTLYPQHTAVHEYAEAANALTESSRQRANAKLMREHAACFIRQFMLAVSTAKQQLMR